MTVPDLPAAYTLAHNVPRHFLTDHLAHIERMAAQFMSPQQIAASLGIPLAALRAAAARHPDVLLALVGGRARGIDEVSAAMYRRATVDGETSAARCLLALSESSARKREVGKRAGREGRSD